MRYFICEEKKGFSKDNSSLTGSHFSLINFPHH